jgi:hypothetical protein
MTHSSPNHMPDDHAGHDRQLVVAFACGDLPAAEVTDARALIGRCRKCAALVDELSIVSTAVRRDLIAPPRPRDFRLTTEDADRLRGSAVTRLLRRLGSPSLKVLQPLAGAAMAIGIVLVLTTSVLPSFSGAAGAAPMQSIVGAAAGDDSARNAAEGEGVGGAELAPVSPAAAPAASAQAGASQDIAGYTETDTSTEANVMELAAPVAPVDPVAPIGLGLVVLGAVVLLARALARRASKDPLLR